MPFRAQLPPTGPVKPETLVLIVIAAVFLAVVAAQLAGHWVGRRQRARTRDGVEGSSSIEASLFALLGLLVGFTFSGAETRLEHRRELLVQEANAVGTAYLRIDVLPAGAQRMLRDELRRYVDARLAYYERLLDPDGATTELRRSQQLQRQIWQDTMMALEESETDTAALVVLPALNDMFDITTAREAALRTHLPTTIFAMLVALALACAFVAGRSMSKSRLPNRLLVIMFAAVLALTGYTILNLEFPRIGFVRLDRMDTMLYDVRAGMD
jgi:hypothetical protein